MGNFRNNWAIRSARLLLEREEGPQARVCESCPTDSSTPKDLYRCRDCTLAPTVCGACMKRGHLHNPFHRIEKWSEELGFWERRWLSDIGLELFLCEREKRRGRCKTNISPGRPTVVVHEHGIQTFTIHYCSCAVGNPPMETPDPSQLIRYGLFPASWDRPETVATVKCLRSFTLLAVQSQINARDYVQYLKRLTDNIEPQEVSVRLMLFFNHGDHLMYKLSLERIAIGSFMRRGGNSASLSR